MKRFLAAMIAAVMLGGLVAGAVSADQGTVTITSATVSHGQVVLTGSIDCTLYASSGGLGVNGQITEAIGHKTTLQGGLNGWVNCSSAGATTFQSWAQAQNGTFSQGWVTVNLGIFDPSTCDQYGNCQNVAGGQFYIKLTGK